MVSVPPGRMIGFISATPFKRPGEKAADSMLLAICVVWAMVSATADVVSASVDDEIRTIARQARFESSAY